MLIDINSCENCSFCEKKRHWTRDPFELVFQWSCAKKRKRIGFEEDCDKPTVPEWCPLKVDKAKEIKEDSNMDKQHWFRKLTELSASEKELKEFLAKEETTVKDRMGARELIRDLSETVKKLEIMVDEAKVAIRKVEL